jgi:hypothetical protein
VAVPDKSRPLQLALNLSAFADDNIQVDFDGGLLKQIHATPAGTRILKYKFVPKLPALELLGKHLKQFSERLEFDGSDSLAALIK